MSRLLRSRALRSRSSDAELDRVLDTRAVRMVFQPVVDLRTDAIVGVEALARFPSADDDAPLPWFERARHAGRSAELDLAVAESIEVACGALPRDVFLAINLTPAGALDPRVQEAVARFRCRLVLEITEHAVVDDYASLQAAAAGFRRSGARIAVDDAGAGISSLRHVLELAPEIVKLDQAITARVTADAAARAMTSAMVRFSDDVGSTLIAEGVETSGQLAMLRDLGVSHGQGFALGRPDSLANVLAA